ncbi:phosphatase PAP2 family protein [Dactylosporangium salmoneum]|uniref:Phosphatidic acid phosphatase type 2/haloperoxidase domain-containing protein n=1 Tax=Dactylosporangium salmoneum TaxID=53361 RepID=A0ABN3GYK8_9ACTN
MLGCGSALLLGAVYALAVRTVPGQRFEDAVLVAAEGRGGSRHATLVLSADVASLVLAVAALLAIGWARRAPRVGAAGVVVLAATVIGAEIVQLSVSRPRLLPHGYRRDDQSFPSGHTAIAVAIMCALVLVVPYRWRLATLVLSSAFAAAVAVAVILAGWHRPGDTLGSDCIALFVVSAVTLVLDRGGRLRRVPRRRYVYRLAAGYGFSAICCAIVVLLAGPLLAGCAIALGGTALVALALLVLLARTESAEATQRRKVS